FQLTTPYFGDSSAGFIESPISSSMMTKMILGNLAAYRPGLTSKARGLEIGLAHGYLFFGPFFKLGPMRGSPVADYVGLMATMAFMLLLTMALTAYTYLNEDEEPSLFTKEFNGGFLVGGWGSAVFAFLIV
ncbi:photosystem I PsaL, reaction centre subunit XI, partial [Pelagophyceae sp. CCMP2097]